MAGARTTEDTTKAALIWLFLSSAIALLLFILYWWKNRSAKKSKNYFFKMTFECQKLLKHASITEIPQSVILMPLQINHQQSIAKIIVPKHQSAEHDNCTLK